MPRCIGRPSPQGYVQWTGSNKSEVDDYFQNTVGWPPGSVNGDGNYAYTDFWGNPQTIQIGYYMVGITQYSPADYAAGFQTLPEGRLQWGITAETP